MVQSPSDPTDLFDLVISLVLLHRKKNVLLLQLIMICCNYISCCSKKICCRLLHRFLSKVYVSAMIISTEIRRKSIH